MMALKVYQQTNVQDPRYVDVTDVGLTADTGITTKDVIVRGDDRYNVMYVVPSQRFHTILLKKVG